ncbi:MAG: hypothetical protein MRZ54_00600 [Clostridiales bacterium]|nr:hypothetical protein [Clostridiales bacterium]
MKETQEEMKASIEAEEIKLVENIEKGKELALVALGSFIAAYEALKPSK